MLCLLSPAKTLQLQTFKRLPKGLSTSTPLLKEKAQELVEILSSENAPDAETKKRFNEYNNGEPEVAGLMYAGPAFKKLDASGFSETEMEFAQESCVILSGLFGFVRPLDEVRPYRLEMASKVTTTHGSKLMDYWKNNGLNSTLQQWIKDTNRKTILNCASAEYFKTINFEEMEKECNVKVIHVEFKAASGRLASVFAKQARGMIVNFVVKNNVEDIETLKTFVGEEENFKYSDNDSTDNRMVFLRYDTKGKSSKTPAKQQKSKKEVGVSAKQTPEKKRKIEDTGSGTKRRRSTRNK